MAQTGAQHEGLWSIREGVSKLLALTKPCAAFDVSVAITRMDELVEKLEAQLRKAFPDRQHLFLDTLAMETSTSSAASIQNKINCFGRRSWSTNGLASSMAAFLLNTGSAP